MYSFKIYPKMLDIDGYINNSDSLTEFLTMFQGSTFSFGHNVFNTCYVITAY